MSLNNVIENPDYKLLFLKAIKLGIMYGQSDKSNFYKEKIDSEINSIIFSKNTEIQPVKQKQEVIQGNYNSNSNSNTNTNTNTNTNDIIMMNLENQKNVIIKNIQNLSNNYSLNYSKINFLKNSLVSTMKEIEKHKELNKNNSSPFIKKNITEIKKKEVQQNENLTSELQDTLNKISSLIIT
jgi:hypothetical protein